MAEHELLSWMVQWLDDDDMPANNFPLINNSNESKKRKRKHQNLKLENEFFGRVLSNDTNPSESIRYDAHLKELDSILSSKNEDEIRKVISKVWSCEESFGVSNTRHIAFSIADMSKNLLSFRTTQYLIYLLSNHLPELALSEHQEKIINGEKLQLSQAGSICEILIQRMVNYSELVSNLAKEVSGLMDGLVSILRPSQFGKFLLWVKTDPACGDILDALWQTTVLKLS